MCCNYHYDTYLYHGADYYWVGQHPAWAYFTAVHAIIVAEDRYHMPATPFMTLLAGLAIAGALRRHAGPRHPAPAPAGRKPSGP